MKKQILSEIIILSKVSNINSFHYTLYALINDANNTNTFKHYAILYYYSKLSYQFSYLHSLNYTFNLVCFIFFILDDRLDVL